MSWVSENKFLTGFGAVMLAGVGTLGYFAYSAMDKYDGSFSDFEKANSQLKRLQEAKPAVTPANLKELTAQKDELTGKISAFQEALKARVLPTEPISKAEFQEKLKQAVAQINAKAAAASVVPPANFYLGFERYQSAPPDDKAAPALARQLRAIELLMNVLIKARSLDLEEFHREPLPEEGPGGPDKGGRKNRVARTDGGPIERHDIRIKFTSTDKELRDVLTGLANHKDQLFVIRQVSVLNKVTESPPRIGGPPSAPAPAADGGTPAPSTPPSPEPGGAAAPAVPPAAAIPAAPAIPAANEGPLAYIFGTEKITSIIELEVLNVVEPKASAEKPEKGAKKKER